MWFESTRLVGDQPTELPLRSRWAGLRSARFIRVVYGLREFALGRGHAPADVMLYTGAEIINVYGNVTKAATDVPFTTQSLLGILGDGLETDGIQINFFWRTAVTRYEFVNREEVRGDSEQRIIWTVTWRIGRKIAVLNSHASFTHSEDVSAQDTGR